MSEMRRSGSDGFAGEEIYSMEVHYYDKDDVEVDKGKSKGPQMKKLRYFCQ